MATKTEVSLSEVETSELIDALGARPLSDGDKDRIYDLCQSEGIKMESPFPTGTMHDDMKREYLQEIWSKYTPEEIEAALPRRY